jgi:O-methyltransferase involved in polyketide biosynthesis
VADFPALPVIEFDHPATQNANRQAIPTQAWVHGNLHLLPLDLTQGTLADTLLGSASYHSYRPAVFVVEGLLMYLQEMEVKDLLTFFKSHSGPFFKLIFTGLEVKSPGDYQFPDATRFVNLGLKIKREKFIWGLLNTELGHFLNTSGLTLLTFKTHRDLRQEFLIGVYRTFYHRKQRRERDLFCGGFRIYLDLEVRSYIKGHLTLSKSTGTGS